ncbi:MAG: protein-glutamate O-methyltransferase CheR [Alphaproteobacteria bacterium]|nr:protein-glutamate O-methyltransferase CheR [Alphaproteobacteria bacterium]
MNDADFVFFEDLLKRESGLSITREKTYLLESRLLPLATRLGLEGLNGIIKELKYARDSLLQKSVVEAMTTNETSFFRDNTPFQRMKEGVIPAFLKARAAQKRLRIWSAACSSGQEPYSLAMMFKEYGTALDGWRVEIVATDLSEDILAQAKQGVYTQFEVQRGLPIQMLVKYFAQEGDKWRVKPDIRNMIRFQPLNLLGSYGAMGAFDIVFCRNVLIYFDVQTKARVLKSIKNVMQRDGVLFLGGAETVIGVSSDFKAVPALKGIYLRDDTTYAAVG